MTDAAHLQSGELVALRPGGMPPGERMIPRPRLLDLIETAEAPIIVIEAAAGMGKSVLLAQLSQRLGVAVQRGLLPPEPAPITLWDLDANTAPQRLAEGIVAGEQRLILAKRPQQDIPGLARAAAYGRVLRLGETALQFTLEELEAHFPARIAARLLEQSGGWPLLLGLAHPFGPEMATFLREEVVTPLGTAELFDLRDRLALPQAVAGQLAIPAPLREPIRQAIGAVLAERAGTDVQARIIAAEHDRRGEVTEAILAYQRAGCLDEAFDVFQRGWGRFFPYHFGLEAFARVLAGFPKPYALANDTLVMSLAMQALKRGEIARARRLIANRFGPAVNDLSTVFADRTRYSTDFLAFRVVMLIYEDYQLTETLFTQVFGMLEHFDVDDHLVRGSFYNSVLEFYIRSRRFAAAEDVANRALYHYQEAGAPLLAFYIGLHQAMMRLMMGDALSARRHAAQAAQSFAQVGFESPSDGRLLGLLEACIDYEGGKAEPLARFLSTQLDAFVHGEIWPSLIEFALQYGSQALSEHFSTIAARSFLDRWRVYQVSNRQFGRMIEMREAAILQNSNRWQEAAEKLAAVPSQISRAWVVGAGPELERLSDRDEIMLCLAWLRHLVHEAPTRPGLERQLDAMRDNLNLTGRQRLSVEIWLAYVCKRQRNLSRARSLLQKAFEEAARLDAIAPLAEERLFLSELIEHQRISDYLDASMPVRQVLRRLRDNGLPNSALGAQSGLSRRETKVLLMISEGASNKFIANALGLSEATVKFHLGNVYRKLGCSRRREAISAARALGLIR